MRFLYFFSLVAVAGAIGLGKVAWDQREETQAVQASNESLQGQIANLEADIQAAEKSDPWPLRFAGQALSEFFTRTVEAGEVLGAGVRMRPRNEAMGARAMSFVDHVQGVKKCEVTLQAGLEMDGAAAILAMFEEELRNLQVAVRKVTAKSSGDAIALTMEIDVFGR